MDELTFLNDKNIDGELYALFQGYSQPIEIDGKYQTIVYKKDIPTQNTIMNILGLKTPKTVRTRLNYLIERGYIERLDNGNYLLPEMENIYFLIPLDTLKYLNDNCKDHVIKTYVYLGQRYKQAIYRGVPYEFTLEELGTHIGLKAKNYSKSYETINNALNLLYNEGLIDYCSYFDGQSQKKKLTAFSLEYKKKSENR